MIKKLIAAVAAAGMVSMHAAIPAFAAQNITISGNGSNSASTTIVTSTQNVDLTQTNVADVTNDIDIEAETGDNDANDNTGGDTSIDTGNVTATSSTTNAVNENIATVGCDCIDDITINTSGNGTGSANTAIVSDTRTYALLQSNDATVTNTVDLEAETGDNDANDNTNGTVSIATGNVLADSTIMNDINSNWASFGSSGLVDGMILVDIIGNGSSSVNTATLAFVTNADLTQDNVADVLNDVELDAESGDNDTNDNTGGDVSVDTGDVDAGVLVDNAINFNSADVDCCDYDVEGDISDNGTSSASTIAYTDVQDIDALQDNDCGGDGDCDTLVDADAESGDNDSNDNTNGEVEVDTGQSTLDVEVVNDINVNDYLTL